MQSENHPTSDSFYRTHMETSEVLIHYRTGKPVSILIDIGLEMMQ